MTNSGFDRVTRSLSAAFHHRRFRQRLARVLPPVSLVLLAAVVLTACGGGGEASSPAAGATGKDAAAADTGPCADYALAIRDLPQAQRELPAKLEEMTAAAGQWEADARLVSLNVGCDLGQFFACAAPEGDLGATADREAVTECLNAGEDGIAWSATFFSPATDASWDFPEREEVIDFDEAPLDVALIDLAKLRDHLVAAGYDDGTVLPVGVDLATPAGPDGAPASHFAYTVMVDTSGGKGENLTTLDVDPVAGTVTPRAS